MRKINKIMMATVSILLTLVLISSCVLSGIFAKYVTSKTASSQMRFERFGVIVEMDVDDVALEELGATVTKPSKDSDEVKSGVYSVTVSNLALKPGDDLTDFVKFEFSGKPNVMCKLVLDVDIEVEDPDAFYVPPDVFRPSNGSNLGLNVMPLGFDYDILSSEDDITLYDYYCDPYCIYPDSAEDCFMYWAFVYEFDWYGYTVVTDLNPDPDSIDYAIEQIIDVDGNFCSMNGEKTDIENGGVGFLGAYNDVIDKLNFSITWPFEYSSSLNGYDGDYDAVNTYIANNNPSITVSYTVRVEQVQSVEAFSEPLS